MSFAAAIDTHTTMQLGENGNPEHAWTNDKSFAGLTQLYFQLTRSTDPTATAEYRAKYRTLLQTAFGPRPATDTWIPANRDYAVQLYKLIGHVRDIEAGKGERQIAYAFIWEYYAFCPALARFALYSFVHPLSSDASISATGMQYGAWSDIKYFCNAVAEYSGGHDHDLIIYALETIGAQLRKDASTLEATPDATISLAARWVAKENKKSVTLLDGAKTTRLGKFTWQFYKLAELMFPYHRTAHTTTSISAAHRKACRELHQLYAPLNEALGTVQIAMAAGAKGDGQWNELSFGRDADGKVGKYNVTGCTLRRHTKAWQNMTKSGDQRSDEGHRVECADNYSAHMALVSEGKSEVRGKTLNTYELAKDALALPISATDRARINGQWMTNSAGAPSTGFMVPLIDVSGSMAQDNSLPLHSAIGTGIRISEHSHESVRHRALTFSTEPSWFNFESYGDDFTGKVQAISKDRNWSASTDLLKACNMILDALVAAKVPPAEAGNVVLVVLSDMQIDGGNIGSTGAGYGGGGGWGATAQERVKSAWSEKGYNCPHIVWWNLRKTSGFPTPTSEPNTTMISGYSASLLKAFEGKGIEALRDYTPEKMLRDMLDHERLRPLGTVFSQTYPEM